MSETPTTPEEFYCASRRECAHHRLVLEAARIPYRLRKEAGTLIIVVPSAFGAHASAELAAYTKENQRSTLPSITFIDQGTGWPGVFGYVAVLLTVFAFEQLDIFTHDWVDAGKTHATLIRQGEWWRTVTALTLHSGLVHLISNITFGGIIGLFAGRMLGSGVAWCSILLAGAAGNLLNSLFGDPDHMSIGASTAVFAAFGLVAAYACMRRYHQQASEFARYTPIIGAAVLLGFLGTSGVRTDVFAHMTGFFAGILVGAVLGKTGDRLIWRTRTHALLGIAAVVFLAGTWLIAFSKHQP